MKFLSKVLCLLLLLGTTQGARAESTSIDDYDNILYVNDVSAAPGSIVTLSVCMKNSVSVPAYQFDMYLPEGFDVATNDDGSYCIDLSLKRTTAKKTNTFNSAKQSTGAIRVLCASTTVSPFDGNDGEVCTIELKVGEDVAVGEYTIQLNNQVMSDTKATPYRVSNYSFTVNVTNEAPKYAEGYVLEFAPFHLDDSEEGVSADLNFNVSEGAAPIVSVEFDVQMPEEWYTNTMTVAESNSALSKRFYTITDPTDNQNGTYHFVLQAKSANYYFGATSHEQTKVGSFTLYKDGGGSDGTYSISSGMHTVNIKNIVATDADGNTYKVAPYEGDVYVGELSNMYVGTTETFHGDYSSADAVGVLQELLGGRGTIEVVDLTGVTNIAEGTTLTTANPNAIILANSDITLGNESNVVVDGVCKKLVLTDGYYRFRPTQTFTAEEAQYKRTVGCTWGTVCLPYEVWSDTEVQYYSLSEVTTDQKMIFSAVDKVEAGSPAVFCLGNGTEFDATAANVEISTMTSDITTGASGWTMYGTYDYMYITPSNYSYSIYYIADNMFWYANSEFKVLPFRAWFGTDTTMAAPAKMFTIGTEDEVTGIETAPTFTGDSVIFDLSGRRINEAQKGSISIINNRKVFTK